jgi:hypothetical protein
MVKTRSSATEIATATPTSSVTSSSHTTVASAVAAALQRKEGDAEIQSNKKIATIPPTVQNEQGEEEQDKEQGESSNSNSNSNNDDENNKSNDNNDNNDNNDKNHNDKNNNNDSNENDVSKKTDEQKKPKNISKHILSQSYWDSPEAKRLFRTREDETDAKKTLERKISILQKALATPTAYQGIIDMKPEFTHLLKEMEIETIKNKIMYLSICYQIAKDNMNVKKSWTECCEETVTYMKNHYLLLGGSFSFVPFQSAKTLQKLHTLFRDKDQIPLSTTNMEKRIQKHVEKKRKLEERHKEWLEKGWARNRKVKKLESQLEKIRGEDQKKKDSYDNNDDQDDDGDDGSDDMISSADYELMMLHRY